MPALPTPRQIKLLYFVHDLNDPAVARRLTMLGPFLASAVIAGFHRGTPPAALLAGWPVLDLGRTEDAKLTSRALSVIGRLLRLAHFRTPLQGTTLIIARQLEMLALAAAARQAYAKNAVLIYECLDVHSIMLRSRVLRWVESRLLKRVDRVIVSAPDFVDAYLRPTHGTRLPPVSLIENKVLRGEHQNLMRHEPMPVNLPWRIGWFGILRCRRSLSLLLDFTREHPGLVHVDLRGRPSLAAIPDFYEMLVDAPDVTYHGPYDRSTDLARIYGAVHFTWALDFYEAGENSTWLLPNRLYEGGANGAVPIADATGATGKWLALRNAGVLLGNPLKSSLLDFFTRLDSVSYATQAVAVAKIPLSQWIDDGQDAADLITAIS